MKPAREVIEDALREEPDSWEQWAHVVALHKRGDVESMEAAAELLDNVDPVRRAVGASILGQLGAVIDLPVEDRPLAGPSFDLLMRRVGVETASEVLAAIAFAFGHLRDPRCVPVMHTLRNHPDEDLRYAVVSSVSGLDDDLAVETLVELSRDPVVNVRDWATFGLGTMLTRDDSQVREALVARLDDPDATTRAEALRGLGVRGDEGAVPRLLIDLDDGPDLDDVSLLEDALLALAVRTGDPRLCRHIEVARREWIDDAPDEPSPDDLRSAVEACEQRSPAG